MLAGSPPRRLPAESPDQYARDGPSLGTRLHDLREVAEIPLDRRHNAKVDYVRLQKMYGKEEGRGRK